MADKRISQLVDRGTVANNDVVPIVVSGATTTNKATISSIQTYMQGNLDLGVTSVGITLGSSGTDVSVTGSPITSSGNITINLPTASATNRGLLSAADWVTFNSKQDAGSFVTLNTTQTITAQKTFTTSGSSDTMIISHGSGSGFALDVLKAGNGEAIRVTKSSGTGNAMTISGGNFEAGTIVKTGGTSSQFLKADGSVDSNTYLTTGTAGSTYVPYFGATSNVDLGVNTLTSSSVILNGSGSNAGIVHLESNAFFSLVNGYGSIASGTTNQFNFYQTTGAGVFRGAILSLNSITASATRTYTLPDADGTLALGSDLGAYLPLTGGTLTGALNGTTATFTGLLSGTTTSFTSNENIIGVINTTNASGATSNYQQSGVNVGWIGNGSNALIGGSTNDFTINGVNSLNLAVGGFGRLTLASTGAATFSSSVGIGVSPTAGKLHILAPSSVSYAPVIAIRDEGNPTFGFSFKLDTAVNGDLRLDAVNNSVDTPLMTFKRVTGNVGIGMTTSDYGRVSIKSNSTTAYAGFNVYATGNANFTYINHDNSVGIIGTEFGSGGTGHTPLTFQVGGSERMRITSGGYLKASPSGTYNYGSNIFTFHSFENNIADWSTAIVNTSASNNYGLLIAYPNNAPNTVDNWFIYCTDNVNVRFRVSSNGNVVNQNGSYGAISDIKLKENIEDASPKLDDLMKVKIRNYNLIGDDKKQIGVIAQELEDVFPAMIEESEDFEEVEVPQLDEEGNEILNEEGEVVTTKERVSKGTTTKSVKYSVFVPMLIKAMQEQQEQIKVLTEQIDSLKNQIK